MLTLVLRIVFFPVCALFWLAGEITGEGPWYRQQRRKMEEERSPLIDEEFLLVENVPESDAALWLIVRRAMAECIGVPSEAIHPQDRIVDLGRMQFDGPHAQDFVFRVERATGTKLPRRSMEKSLQLYYTRGPEEFRELARVVVSDIREIGTKP